MTTLVYSTAAYDYLADEVCGLGAGCERGEVERKQFPDGEHYRRLVTDCDDRDVVLVGGTVTDGDTLELYDLACALVYYGARRLTLVIPFFGYSTMERAVKEGEVVTAKARARLLSSIPSAALTNRVLLFDLHVDGVTHYFEGEMHPVQLYGKPVVSDLARQLGGGGDFVLACTDAGRAKWVESLANTLGVTAAFVYKRRLSGSQTQVAGVSAHVRGKNVVIYDDMVRTGSSLIGAAQAYRDAGATDVSAVCTHGVLPGDSLARIEASGALSHLACTNSHPRAVALGQSSSYLRVESIAPLLAARIGVGP